jgi:hypothetical protein
MQITKQLTSTFQRRRGALKRIYGQKYVQQQQTDNSSHISIEGVRFQNDFEDFFPDKKFWFLSSFFLNVIIV